MEGWCTGSINIKDRLMQMNRAWKTAIVLLTLSVFGSSLYSEDSADAPRWAIRGGKIVTVTKGAVEGGVLLVSGGRIEKIIASPAAD